MMSSRTTPASCCNAFIAPTTWLTSAAPPSKVRLSTGTAPSAHTPSPVCTCLRSGRRSLGWPYFAVPNSSAPSSYAPYSDIEVMSQCTWDMSSPNSAIALSPTAPLTASSCSANASNARPARSSLSALAVTPNTSSTAQVRAHRSRCTSGSGEVNRLATSISMTCPCVTHEVDTSRIGHSASTRSAMRSRRQNSATTGNEPSIFSTLAGPYTPASVRSRPLLMADSEHDHEACVQPRQRVANVNYLPLPPGH